MSAPYDVLPAANADAARRKPTNVLPLVMPVAKAAPLPDPKVPVTPLAGGLPKFRGVIGMPPVMPKGHLNSLAYIG
jgi:hypothetical protein